MRSIRTRAQAEAGPRRILAACFSRLPESRFLGPALQGLAVLQRVGDRGRVIPQAVSGLPAVLILPSVDAAGLATAPLAERCLAEAPSVSVIIIASGRPGAGHAIGRSLQTGAMVISVANALELRLAIKRVMGERPVRRTPRPRVPARRASRGDPASRPNICTPMWKSGGFRNGDTDG